MSAAARVPTPDEETSSPVRVVVADDHRLTAHSIGDALERHGMIVEARVFTAADALASCLELTPDALVVDLDMGPGPTGIDVAVQVRKSLRRLGVVLLTGYEDPRLLDPGLPALPPACVYLVKQKLADTTEVVDAVGHAVELIGQKRPELQQQKGVSLTDSQVEILRLVAGGLSNQAIAARMSLSVAGVEKAINRLAKKLEVDSEADTNSRVGLTHRYLDMTGYVRD
jgi:DNA-binding NarL/FixJ family response regulator